MTNTFSISEALKIGWKLFRKSSVFFILTILMAGVFYLLSSLINFLAVYMIDSLELNRIFMSVVQFLTIVLFLYIQLTIILGLLKTGLRNFDGENTRYSEIHSQSRYVIKSLVASLIYSVIISVGFLLFIVPGFIWMARFYFFEYFIIDKDQGPIEALKSSFKVTKGYTFKTLGLFILISLINTVGLLLLGLGLIVTIPLTCVALAYAYRTFNNSFNSNQDAIDSNHPVETSTVQPSNEVEVMEKNSPAQI